MPTKKLVLLCLLGTGLAESVLSDSSSTLTNSFMINELTQSELDLQNFNLVQTEAVDGPSNATKAALP